MLNILAENTVLWKKMYLGICLDNAAQCSFGVSSKKDCA